VTTKYLTTFVLLYYYNNIALKMATIAAETHWWKIVNKIHHKHWSVFCWLFTNYILLLLGPTQPHRQWVPGLFLGGKAVGAWRWPPTPT